MIDWIMKHGWKIVAYMSIATIFAFFFGYSAYEWFYFIIPAGVALGLCLIDLHKYFEKKDEMEEK